MNARQLQALRPGELIAWLRAEKIDRFHLAGDGAGGLQASHLALQPLAEAVAADRRDFQAHEGLFFQASRSSDTLLGAFVHRTCRGQAAGGLRYWGYGRFDEVLSDGLRLAAGMTRKNALAGLWWGGGKGILARDAGAPPLEGEARAELYREYGEFVTALRGCYVTAEDVGTGPEDMAQVFRTTRHVTCVPPALGGSGNPSGPTARGVLAGIEAGLEHLGLGPVAGRSVAVQGLGHVAQPLIEGLFARGAARVMATDIDRGLVDEARLRFVDRPLVARRVELDDLSIFSEAVDVFAPCATGAILNPTTIPLLKAKLVCGAANNQLEDPVRDDEALKARGIAYAPDFLVNRMGIVNCADEGAGWLPVDPLVERHLGRDWEHSIHRLTLAVLAGPQAPGQAATELADRLSLENHPIAGHRGWKIVEGLVADRWFEDAGR